MIGKIGVLMMLAIGLVAMPMASADPALGNCKGDSKANAQGGDDCTGVCSDQNAKDNCTGVCTDGSCGGIWALIWGATEGQQRSDRPLPPLDGCHRVVPYQPVYHPLTGEVVYEVDVKTEVCL